jgi:hypothetical protein
VPSAVRERSPIPPPVREHPPLPLHGGFGHRSAERVEGANVLYQNGDGTFDAPRGFWKGALVVGQDVRNILVLSMGFFRKTHGSSRGSD